MDNPISDQTKLLTAAMLNYTASLGARDHQEIYLSTPITSGLKLTQWLESSGISEGNPEYQEQHRINVIEPNIKEAITYTVKLRRVYREYNQLVINPAEFIGIDGWTQEDYYWLWEQTIKRFAKTIVFAHDWQYSNGCVVEFFVALENNIHMVNENLDSFDRRYGIDLIAKDYPLVSFGIGE